MIHIEEITSFDTLLTMHQSWNEVFKHSDNDFPFLSFEWISCWWQSYGGSSELFVLVAKENDVVVGIAPLMKTVIKHRGLHLKAITFIANYHSNRSGFILTNNKKEVLTAMIDYMRAHQKDTSMYCLDFVPQGSDSDVMLSEVLSSRHMKWFKTVSLVSPYIKIDQSWDEYYKNRTKKFRLKMNNTSNYYLRTGGCEIIQYTHKEIDKAMKELLHVSERTWQFRQGESIMSTKENRSFYDCFSRLASEKGWLSIWILKVNALPIAFAYSLIYNEKVMILAVGFDEDYSKDSPGEFLSMNVISDSFENNRKEYDFLGGNNPYKLKWASLVREHAKYLVFSENVYGYLLSTMEYTVVPLIKKAIRMKSRIFSTAKS